MAVVEVKYLGNFSLLTRKRREKVAIAENEKVGSLLEKLGKKYGRKLALSLSADMTAFLLNGTPALKETALHPGDELVIATMVGGG